MVDVHHVADVIDALARRIETKVVADQPAPSPHQIIVEVQKALESLKNAPYRETMDYYLGQEMKELEDLSPILRRITPKLRPPDGPPSQQPAQQPPQEKPQPWMSSNEATAVDPGRAPMPPKPSEKDATIKVIQKVKQALMRLGEPDLLGTIQKQVGTDFQKLVDLSKLLGTAIQRLQSR